MRKHLGTEAPEFISTKESNLINKADILNKNKLTESLETPEAQEKNFGERLDDLKAAISEMSKHGEEINEEMFENIMGLPFNEFQDYVNSGKIIKQNDLKSFQEKVSEVINGEFNKTYTGNHFRNVMNKPLRRAFFAAVCLFLTSGVAAQAHNNETVTKDKLVNGTEVKVPDNLDSNPDAIKANNHTYKFNPEAVNSSALKEAAIVDITQGFEVDKASIPDQEINEIKKEIDIFLNKINKDNFNQYSEAKKIVYGSSDSRATKYGAEDKKLDPTLENNIKLSKDRCLEGIRVIKESFLNHDYSKSGLNPEQITKIKQVEPEFKIPEKGYTKISELSEINPKTGEKYTDQDVKEIEKNNPGLYKELNDKCRYVKLDLMVESLVKVEPSLEKVSQCDRAIFFIDNSPSTEHTKNDMAKKLEELGIKENKKGHVAQADLVYFSSDANQVKTLPNILAVADDLRRVASKGASVEYPFKSSISYLNNLIKTDQETAKNGGHVEDNRAAFYTTDEGLQDVQNIIEAVKLLKQANVKNASIFIYSPFRIIPLEKNVFELKDEIEKVIKAKLELNLATLEQSKQNEENNLNNIITEANEKLSPKTMNEFFGQDKLSHENGEIKINKDKNHQLSQLEKINKSSRERIVLRKLIISNDRLEKLSNLYEKAKNETFEDYLKKTQIEITVFTEKDGTTQNFDILGHDKLAENIERASISL